jgi:predicted DNA-binding protein YlxM (UPF0122 family)
MPKLILHNLDEDEFKKLIKDSVFEVMELFSSKNQLTTEEYFQDELIKLSEVAQMLKVSKVTIHTWKRKGLIPFYRISNKIYFKKHEVISTLNEIKYSKQIK